MPDELEGRTLATDTIDGHGQWRERSTGKQFEDGGVPPPSEISRKLHLFDGFVATHCRSSASCDLRHVQVQEGPTCVYTTCPEHKCQLIASEAVFKEFVPHEDLERYQSFSLTSFVDINKTLRFCPGKDCRMVVKAPMNYSRSVRCKCGSVFCFRSELSCGVSPARVPIFLYLHFHLSLAFPSI